VRRLILNALREFNTICKKFSRLPSKLCSIRDLQIHCKWNRQKGNAGTLRKLIAMHVIFVGRIRQGDSKTAKSVRGLMLPSSCSEYPALTDVR
jgi:hypothetical protein